MSRIVDAFIVYKFLKQLSTPFVKWEAYDKGIIDKNGSILKRRKLSKFELMVLKIKTLIERIPGGSRNISSYAAALWLIKEWVDNEDAELTEEKLSEYITMVEEAPVNSAGGGHVDGIGVGEKGEPGVYNHKKKRTKMFKRTSKK